MKHLKLVNDSQFGLQARYSFTKKDIYKAHIGLDNWMLGVVVIGDVHPAGGIDTCHTAE